MLGSILWERRLKLFEPVNVYKSVEQMVELCGGESVPLEWIREWAHPLVAAEASSYGQCTNQWHEFSQLLTERIRTTIDIPVMRYPVNVQTMMRALAVLVHVTQSTSPRLLSNDDRANLRAVVDRLFEAGKPRSFNACRFQAFFHYVVEQLSEDPAMTDVSEYARRLAILGATTDPFHVHFEEDDFVVQPISTEDEYEVIRILNHAPRPARTPAECHRFYVHWSTGEQTWISSEDAKGCPGLLREYWDSHNP